MNERKMQRTLIAFFLLVLSSFVAANPVKTIRLNGSDWKLSYWEQPQRPVTSPNGLKSVNTKTISATVPGNVELDLLAAGLIEDPMVGCNTDKLRSWEGYQWCYTKDFTAPALEEGQICELFFGGIDCLADIWIDDRHVGSTENMLIEHVFDVTSYLKAGKRHTLRVILRSALLEGENHLLGTLSIGNFPAEESIYIRKAPHMFGWDILPRLVSAGLWRDVELRVQNPARLRDVNYMVARLNGKDATLYLDIQVKLPSPLYSHAFAKVTMRRNGKVAFQGDYRIYTPAFRYTFGMKDCDLWWPHGYGEAALYDAHIDLTDENGNILDTDDRRIGIRTVRLERNDIILPDQPGKFRFYVNEVPIFVRGTNWVPLDALHSRDKSLVKDAVDMAVDLNCNMLRCWGGNVYEDHLFYDLCDENGLMIWQDFTMGCTMYPQRDDFAKALETEVISVVTKLRNHPCIVLWAGNNEDDSASHWSLAPFDINPNLDRVSREVIPRVIYEFDVTRPYLPSSPYYSQAVYEHGSGEHLLPEVHLWGPRGYYKDAYYAKAGNVFVSEIGYHGCPNMESLKKMMTPDCVYPWTHDFQWNEEWLTKSVRRFPELGQTNDRNNLMLNQISIVFGEVPRKLEDFIQASQSVQAEAMKFFVELWRGHKFEGRNGIIWWNLRDGWPLISDAVTDYWNSKKKAYYYIRNVQKDVCCMICDAENGYELIAVNDTPVGQNGEVKVTDVESGRVIYENHFMVPENGRTVLTLLAEERGQGMYCIDYKVGGEVFKNHYLYGKPPYKLENYLRWVNSIGFMED